ncbi:small metal-binding protein SmbP [Methylomonas sp. AM2-LC]|uniref:small metal-binding protein SmbP n=1 Tax=Methylomonas sp. AM2-LC TaxID=3153301 RepID=UPI003264D144
MNNSKKIQIGFLAGMALTLCTFNVLAADSHFAQALKHAEEAAKAVDAKSIVVHAEASKSHVTIADEHLDAGAKSLADAIEHGNQGHTELAKKAAEEAVTHLKAAQ